MKIFLDSDIILDALLERHQFYLPAVNVITLAYQNKYKAVTSSVAFLNVHYFLNKFDKANKISLLKDLRAVVSIINIDETIIDTALNSEINDFEDAVQYYSALNARADFILTRNIKDYKQSVIPVLTAEQFLRTL